MKKHYLLACLVTMLLISMASGQSTKFRSGVFLHHSTGLRVWGPNGSATSVAQEVAAYNAQRGLTGQNAVSLNELSWPPVADNEWERWHRVFENKDTLVEDIRPILTANRIVMIKSCFTSSQITGYGKPADTLTPTLKTIYNYKWHWRSILKVMKQRPQDFFVIWTGAPLVASVTNNQQAILSDKFSRWAKDTLAKGLDPQFGPFPANVYVFDFFHKLAGIDGKLPLNYAVTADDSHPNAAATFAVAPQLVREVFDAALIYEGQGTGIAAAPALTSPLTGATGLSTGPTLSWNASAGAITYRLQVSTVTDFSSTVSDQSGLSGTTRALTGLANNTLYYWRVNATNTSGTSAWSQMWSFTTSGSGPVAPTPTSPADSAIGLPLTQIVRWSSCAGATSYRLQVSTVPDFSSTIFDRSNLPGTAQTLSGLANNTKYYWRSNAANASGTSVWSPAWRFTTVGVGPLPPALAGPADSSNGVPLTPVLRWASSAGAASYRLQVSNVPDFSSTVFDQSNIPDTTGTVTTLANSKLHYWRVSATNASGTSAWSQVWKFTTVGATPVAPTLAGPADSSNGVSLTPVVGWTSSSGATSYRLQVSLASDFSSTVFDQSGLPGTTQNLSALVNNTVYYWRVNAANTWGTSAWSGVRRFTTVGVVPSAPSLVGPADTSNGNSLSPTLRWKATPGAMTYRVQVSLVSDFSSTVFDQGSLADSMWTISPLVNSKLYFWRVNATNAWGTSAWSQVWSFTTAGVPPQAPTLASPTDSSNGLSLPPTVRWASSVGATSYRLQVSKVSDFASTVFDQNNLAGTAQTLSELDNSKQYFWRVNATNASGTSGWSQACSFTTICGIASAPPLVSPADSSNGVTVTPIVRWSSLVGATSYRLQVSDNSGFATVVFDRNNLPGTAQTLSGLSNSKLYYWRVSATNAAGTGAWSRAWSFTTIGTGPAAPTPVSPASGSVNLPLTPIVRWSTSAGAASYRLQVSVASDFSTTVFDRSNLPGTAQTLYGLANNRRYYWRANATSALGTSAWSQVWNFTTSNALSSQGTADSKDGAVEVGDVLGHERVVPSEYSLSQNYPNPFNPSTEIRFGVPKSSKVSLSIYNAIGQLVVTLVDEQKDPGSYIARWNANVPTGIYFYRLRAGDYVEIRKMILLK